MSAGRAEDTRISSQVYPDVRMPTAFHNAYFDEIIEWKPDVIHSQCEFFTFQFATHISRATGAPIVHTYHTLYEQYVSYLFPSRRLGRLLVRVLSRKRLKEVKTLVAPTMKVENALHSYGIQNPISVVPSGISLEQHHQRLTPEERLERRRELALKFPIDSALTAFAVPNQIDAAVFFGF